MADGAQHLQPHKLQLCSFLLGMGHSISTVTHLIIDATPLGDGAAQRLAEIAACFNRTRTLSRVKPPAVPVGPCVAELLLAFAQACPAVQKLEVLGVVGEELFSAFGVSCSNLNSLVLTGCALKNLTQPLVKIMPRLSHVQLTRTAPFIAAEPRFLSLFHGASLTHVDIGQETVTAELWNALPALRVLRGGFSRLDLVGLQTKPRLLDLQLVCTVDDHLVPLAQLAAVLRAAPKLNSLGLEAADLSLKPYVWLERVLTLDHDFGYVHDRLAAELTATSTPGDCGGQREGVSLFMEDCEQWTAEEDLPEWAHSDITSFFTCRLPMPAFTGLKVSVKTFGHSDEDRLSSRLAALFPNLADLELDTQGIDHYDLSSLAACTSLRSLMLMSADVTVIQLAMLVPYLPVLEFLRVEGSADFYASDAGLGDLQDLLQAWGSLVEVIDMKTL